MSVPVKSRTAKGTAMKEGQQRFFTGILFAGVGLLFGIGAWRHYPLGTSASMGPAYFPVLLSSVLVAIGLLVLLQADWPQRPFFNFDVEKARNLRPLIYVLASNFLFAILLKGVSSIGITEQGLVPAVFAATFVASMASNEHRTKPALILAGVLSAFFYIVFVLAMGMPIAAWPNYFSS
ncbi:tripartite tricarboxylate transporter TctB family protein [Herbaspirillum sp. 1130]|uniref:tripartite tricarboxylate transporter TctB family protein n=1 Tax=Herbaspirillum sp. 1130 TaxID=2806562 RepID=UPI001AE94CE8|nr:tripartite tricarboxylate transporter TctB family protein [Herbaspirillum sp. 1130]MBP1318290.1 hypothetical protein [Herbaspirillum sp. 1130]